MKPKKQKQKQKQELNKRYAVKYAGKYLYWGESRSWESTPRWYYSLSAIRSLLARFDYKSYGFDKAVVLEVECGTANMRELQIVQRYVKKGIVLDVMIPTT